MKKHHTKPISKKELKQRKKVAIDNKKLPIYEHFPMGTALRKSIDEMFEQFIHKSKKKL